MLRRISQIGTEITFTDLFSGYRGIFFRQETDFREALGDYLSSRHIYLLNSGTAAFYIILEVLKDISFKKEVILPAYTAPAMVLPILKAGFKPVLCDISLKDFNLDLDLLPEVITEDTLCIVPTHMFGIVNSGIEDLKEKVSEIYIIEDCAQSMGSKIKGKHTGSFSDIAFLSFNRGKNLPTYGGGGILTHSSELAQKIRAETDKLIEQSIRFKLALIFKITAFSLAVKPEIYGALYPIISQFKDNRIPASFSVGKYTNFLAGLGISLLKRIDAFSEKRYQNGIFLSNALAQIKGIILPSISGDTTPAFSRFPVLFKDLKLREEAEEAFAKIGIDTSRMYLKPLHHIFDLGYRKEDFPNACYFAEHLLTLPVHPLAGEKDLIKIIEVIRKICSPGGI